jgi:hypothetical protein
VKELNEVSILRDDNLEPTGEYIKIERHVSNWSVIIVD